MQWTPYRDGVMTMEKSEADHHWLHTPHSESFHDPLCVIDSNHTGECVYGYEEQGEDVKVEETPAELVFEDQNFQPPIYITLARMYDLLAVIALKADPDRAEQILSAHEAGHLWAESPYLVLDDETLPTDDEESDEQAK
jgi:hypothetical protein